MLAYIDELSEVITTPAIIESEKLMNRRYFVLGSGLTLGAVVIRPSRAIAQTSGPNANTYSSGTVTNAIASGNALVATSTNNDWNTVGNSMSTILTDWTTNNIDSQIQQFYSQVAPSNVKSSNLNQAAILKSIQQSQPTATAVQLQNAFAGIDAQPISAVQQVLADLEQNGFAKYIRTAIAQSSDFAQAAFQVPPKGGHIVQPLPAVYHPNEHVRLRTVGTGCQDSNAASLAVGTAFVVIAIMAGPADVLALAAWGAISLWGGAAAGTWAIGNAIVCGF